MNNSDLPVKLIRSNFPEDIPDAYIKGYVEFYKLKFKVTPDVLIPRPETELLVDEVLKFILRPSEASGEVQNLGSSPFQSNNNSFTILDIGTGSGNIAISIAKNAPKVKIFATDISEAALNIARENAKKNKVEKKIFFLQSDLLNVIANPGGVKQSQGAQGIASVRQGGPRNDVHIDIIVTNLPYIPSSRIYYLDPSVKDFEPRIALDGGSDGFDLYRRLFKQIKEKFLNSPVTPAKAGIYRNNLWIPDQIRDDNGLKLIVCEIDDSQGQIGLTEAKKYFPEAKIEVKLDLAKKQRILVIKY